MSRKPAIEVGGIPFGMDLSWVAITSFVVAAIGLRVSWDGTSAAVAVTAGVLGALLLVIGVAGHEVAHALTARARGIPVTGVTLFVFGGYTEMEDEPGTPGDEMAVAVAGPVASLLMAAVLGLARVAIGRGAFGDVFGLMAVVNLAVAVFNLLPGLPLDGGRILRALVWRATGDPQRGTDLAVRAGRAVGAALALGGVIVLAAARAPGGLWGIAVGWFLFHSAAAAGRMSGLRGSPVSAVMERPDPAVAPTDILATVTGPVPVVGDGRVVGVVPAGSPTAVPAEAVMIPLQRGDVVDADTPVGDVLERVERTGRPVVVVSSGRMVGVATMQAMQSHLSG